MLLQARRTFQKFKKSNFQNERKYEIQNRKTFPQTILFLHISATVCTTEHSKIIGNVTKKVFGKFILLIKISNSSQFFFSRNCM